MLKEFFKNSLTDILVGFFEWVEGRPRWLRPAFYGAGLIYAFMIWRGGLIILPLLFLYGLFKEPALLFKTAIPLLLVYVPGAGFLGGLMYSATDPLLRHFGRGGKILQYVLGTWVYCVLLVFLIMPLFDKMSKERAAPSAPTEDWIISGVMGLLFGVTLGIVATSKNRAA